MHSGMDDPCGPGCPIRKSQDQSSVTSSLGLIAGSYVLHRLSTPRHPPCALDGLTVLTPPRHDWDAVIQSADTPLRRHANRIRLELPRTVPSGMRRRHDAGAVRFSRQPAQVLVHFARYLVRIRLDQDSGRVVDAVERNRTRDMIWTCQETCGSGAEAAETGMSPLRTTLRF
jgi:hypothetical protein